MAVLQTLKSWRGFMKVIVSLFGFALVLAAQRCGIGSGRDLGSWRQGRRERSDATG
jgi:hypothetical protein